MGLAKNQYILKTKTGLNPALWLLLFLGLFGKPNSAQALDCQYLMGKMHEAVRSPHIWFSPTNLTNMTFVSSVMLNTRERADLLIPLDGLNTIHTINTSEAKKKVLQRAETLARNIDRIESRGSLDFELQNELIPSIYPMMGVKDNFGNFVIFDGNGRFEAIKLALRDKFPKLPIQILLFDTKGAVVPNFLLHRVMTAYGLPIPRLEVPTPVTELNRQRVNRFSLIGEMLGVVPKPVLEKPEAPRVESLE